LPIGDGTPVGLLREQDNRAADPYRKNGRPRRREPPMRRMDLAQAAFRQTCSSAPDSRSRTSLLDERSSNLCSTSLSFSLPSRPAASRRRNAFAGCELRYCRACGSSRRFCRGVSRIPSDSIFCYRLTFSSTSVTRDRRRRLRADRSQSEFEPCLPRSARTQLAGPLTPFTAPQTLFKGQKTRALAWDLCPCPSRLVALAAAACAAITEAEGQVGEYLWTI
jgi:hypothetical protein